MGLILNFLMDLLSEVFRAFTGKLYTDEQIRTISSGAFGKYFSEFFPTPKDELAAKERADSARMHISAASSIIRDMHEELDAQDRKLGELLKEVEKKKKMADSYQALANTDKKAFEAFRSEMEEALRKELQQQAEKGKRIRQIVSLIFWVVTLIAGAALGAYFTDIVKWIKGGA